jgi:outer membrane protein assembly factor BamA
VELFHRGYPDTTAAISSTNRQSSGITNLLDLTVTVQSGPRIRLGELHFEGLNKTRQGVVERRVRLEPGELLDRVEVDRARLRLARLGVFDSVAVTYESTGDDERDVRFQLEEGKRMDFHLLFGYGSYELLRGGFELDQHNLFGLAHHSRLQAIQSFKSSSADYLYTVPDVGGRDVNLFFNASGLRREEISFEREEVLFGVGGAKTFSSIDSALGLRYNYEFLNANDPAATPTVNDEVVRVGAMVLDFKHDRRDSPLMPRRGYKILADLELASTGLGGEVDYQRFEFSSSWHLGLRGGRYWHMGVSQGVATTLNSEDDDLPINKRFFPGGENSIRGFQQGEAAPRDEAGKVVGAETYLLGNFELEQKLTRSFSAVVFFDALGIARHMEDYPFDEELYSVGGGLWWKTIIGPVRLEYGYNLNPRPKDPSGTLHLSLGFPF